MTIGCPKVSVRRALRPRAVTSATPPGATLTITCTGFAGHGCACTAPATSMRATQVKSFFIRYSSLVAFQEIAEDRVETLGILDVGDVGGLRHRAMHRARHLLRELGHQRRRTADRILGAAEIQRRHADPRQAILDIQPEKR